MDRVTERLWRANAPPFDDVTLATELLALPDLRRAWLAAGHWLCLRWSVYDVPGEEPPLGGDLADRV